MEQFLDFVGNFTLFGNTGDQYINALAVLLIVYIFLKIGKKLLLLRLNKITEKTKTKIDDHIVEILAGISNFFLLWTAFYFINTFLLNFGEIFGKYVTGIFIIVAIYEVIKLTGKIITVFFSKKLKDETTVHVITLVIKIVLWSIGILLILSNLGFNVSTLAASMGIGGIAIALAAQNILGDLFASFSIFFDKPFRIGDFIVIGTDKGTVKKIGMKSTRIQTLQGEELIVSNQELMSTRIQNFKKMKARRKDFSLGLVYGTPVKKLKEAKQIIEEVITAEAQADFMRAHFESFGDFSLNFKITYRIESGDINDYLNTQESINLNIAERFEKAKIEMAFPTQTIHIEK